MTFDGAAPPGNGAFSPVVRFGPLFLFFRCNQDSGTTYASLYAGSGATSDVNVFTSSNDDNGSAPATHNGRVSYTGAAPNTSWEIAGAAAGAGSNRTVGDFVYDDAARTVSGTFSILADGASQRCKAAAALVPAG